MADHGAVARLITSVGFTRGTPDDIRGGLIGYVTCVFGGALLLDGIALRTTAEGRLTLSFPARTDRGGRKHSLYRPIDNPTRTAIEAAIFHALEIDQTEVG